MGLPQPFDWKLHQPYCNLDITVAAVFGQNNAVRIAQSQLLDAQCEAIAWLCEIANVNQCKIGPAD